MIYNGWGQFSEKKIILDLLEVLDMSLAVNTSLCVSLRCLIWKTAETAKEKLLHVINVISITLLSICYFKTKAFSSVPLPEREKETLRKMNHWGIKP